MLKLDCMKALGVLKEESQLLTGNGFNAVKTSVCVVYEKDELNERFVVLASRDFALRRLSSTNGHPTNLAAPNPKVLGLYSASTDALKTVLS